MLVACYAGRGSSSSPVRWRTDVDKASMSSVGISRFLRHADISTTIKHYVDNTEAAAPYLAGVMA